MKNNLDNYLQYGVLTSINIGLEKQSILPKTKNIKHKAKIHVNSSTKLKKHDL